MCVPAVPVGSTELPLGVTEERRLFFFSIQFIL